MMERQKWNDGQEIIFQDLNKLQSRVYKTFFDHVIYELLQRQTDGFFNTSLKVLFTGATAAQVSSGLGFMTVAGGASEEPIKQAVFRAALLGIVFTTPDSSDPRIDLVVAKAARVDGASELRKFKDDGTGQISNQNLFITEEDEAEIQVVAGVPAPGPVAPAVPAGFIELAACLINASTGMADQSDITDSRKLLPVAGSPDPTGSEDYDRIVGDITKIGITDADLKAALDNSSDGDKILVLKSEALNAIPNVLKNNIEIVFKRGVTLSKGTSIVGLRITGNDCLVKNIRLLDFATGGDKGIDIIAGANRTMLERTRFNNCDTNLADAGTDTFNNNSFNE